MEPESDMFPGGGEVPVEEPFEELEMTEESMEPTDPAEPGTSLPMAAASLSTYAAALGACGDNQNEHARAKSSFDAVGSLTLPPDRQASSVLP